MALHPNILYVIYYVIYYDISDVINEMITLIRQTDMVDRHLRLVSDCPLVSSCHHPPTVDSTAAPPTHFVSVAASCLVSVTTDSRCSPPARRCFPQCTTPGSSQISITENGFMFNGKSQFVTSQHFQNVTGKSQLSQLFCVLFACLSHINFAFVTYARHKICE